MRTAHRTLVKSQPELWALIDQPSRMHGLMCALLGRAAEVTVNQREPESVLCWAAADAGEEAWIKVELAEKGWGTHVELSAETATEPVRLEGWLDAVLDELATPSKRPFEGMTETPPAEAPAPEAVIAEAPAPEPAQPEPTAVEDVQADPTPAEDPTPVEEPPAETAPAPAPPRKKRRRFFRF